MSAADRWMRVGRSRNKKEIEFFNYSSYFAIAFCESSREIESLPNKETRVNNLRTKKKQKKVQLIFGTGTLGRAVAKVKRGPQSISARRVSESVF